VVNAVLHLLIDSLYISAERHSCLAHPGLSDRMSYCHGEVSVHPSTLHINCFFSHSWRPILVPFIFTW